MEIPETKCPDVHLNEIAAISYNFPGKYPSLLDKKQVLFKVECADGVFVVYISPSLKKYTKEEK